MASNSLHNALTLPPLPDGWTYQELGDLLEPDGLSYGVVQPGSHDPEGVPILRVKNLHGGKISTDDILRVANDIEQKHHRTRLRGGEVLLSLVGSVGEVAVVPASLAGWNVARAIAVIRVSSDVSSSWIKLCLSTDLARRCMGIWQTDTVQATLNLRDVRRLPIVMPPKLEREAIAAVLGALDDKIAVNERIARTSLDLADAHFELVTRDLACGSETFGSVAEVFGGGTPRTSEPAYWDGPISWATPSDVTGLSVPYLFTTARKITEKGLAECASKLYPPGSIFMTSRATIGAFAVPQIPAAVNQGFIVVIPRRPEMRWWLFHEMRSRVDEMRSLANGSTFLELSRKNFKAMRVRLAEPDVIARFSAQVDPLHKRAAKCVEESHTLAELRDTLLPKLMSGELRVRDAEKAVEEAL